MTVLRYSHPIAKKEHRCNFCNGIIQIGEKYNYQANIFDGDFYAWKSHIRCLEIASKLKMYEHCDEGVTEDDFYESIKEEYMYLQSKYNNEEYENLSDKYPSFKEQLDYVCWIHLNNHPVHEKETHF